MRRDTNNGALQGEEVFSRVLYGRVSLEVAFVATFFSVAIGVVLGMLALLLIGGWLRIEG